MPKPWKKKRDLPGGDGSGDANDADSPDAPSTPQTLHTERVVDELDLHGLTADQAEQRLEMFMERVAVTAKGEVVRVITGRGAGSAAKPVLQGVVRDALVGWLQHRVVEWAVDVGSGAYLVRVRG